jgi:hypothetical protein
VSALTLAIAVLATWRVTHLIVAEDGPWNAVARLRLAAGATFWGGLMDCFYCASVWVALPLAFWITEDWLTRLVAWPAISGGAILLERIAPAPMNVERPEPPAGE